VWSCAAAAASRLENAGPHRWNDRAAAAMQASGALRSDATLRCGLSGTTRKKSLQPGCGLLRSRRRMCSPGNAPLKRLSILATRAQSARSWPNKPATKPSAHAAHEVQQNVSIPAESCFRPDLVAPAISNRPGVGGVAPRWSTVNGFSARRARRALALPRSLPLPAESSALKRSTPGNARPQGAGRRWHIASSLTYVRRDGATRPAQSIPPVPPAFAGYRRAWRVQLDEENCFRNQ